MFDVVTIGSVTRDVFLEASKLKTIPWKKTLSKKALVLPLGEKLETTDVYFSLGGNAANAAVTFSRLGFKTACVGKTGDDPGGWEIRRRLAAEKVDTSMLAKTDKLATAYSVLLLNGGERTILVYHGASGLFNLKNVNLNKLKAKWWYLSLSGESTKIFGNLIEFAKKNKIKIAFNPTGYHLKHYKQDILKHLKDISFLVLNEEEAATLAGFKKLGGLMPGGILAVTNGRKGAVVSDGEFIYQTGIFKEKKLADRTGAGDAFGSGFVAGLMQKNDISYALRYASANATSVVEKIGATEGILTKAGFKNSRWNNLKIKVQKI